MDADDDRPEVLVERLSDRFPESQMAMALRGDPVRQEFTASIKQQSWETFIILNNSQ